MRADLHIHTTASDGTWTPQELVQQALQVGLGALAVTDHDSVGNVAETARLAQAAGLKLLPAAEICSTKADLSFHILGYGIDITNKHLLELMQHNQKLLEQKDVDSIRLLERDGWPVSSVEFARYAYDSGAKAAPCPPCYAHCDSTQSRPRAPPAKGPSPAPAPAHESR